nr:SMI1/KNR4 family protein [uncultured Sphingomonas sp.]
MFGSLVGAVAFGTFLPSACALRQMGRGAAKPIGSNPQRPEGNAKPMLDGDIAPVLARLDKWYAAHLPADRYVFNAPALAEEIAAFERSIGVKTPRSYHQLYRWHNGENDDRRGHLYGLPLLPLAGAEGEWKSWMSVLADFKGNRYAIPGGAWPQGAVDPAYINPRWIPLTSDGSGNHIGLDFDPWPGGRVGQVILFGRDEDVKAVLADSLGHFLGWIADLLESDNVRLTIADGERVLREFRLKTPDVDHFHEGARRLLGAPGPFL